MLPSDMAQKLMHTRLETSYTFGLTTPYSWQLALLDILQMGLQKNQDIFLTEALRWVVRR